MLSLKKVINSVRHRRLRRIKPTRPHRRILNYISNPNSNSQFGRSNARRSLSASPSRSRNKTPSNADRLDVAARDKTYNDINPNDTRGLMRLNSSEDSADSTDIFQLSASSHDSLQVTACDEKKIVFCDEKKIVFSPLKSDYWWMDRIVRDGRKAIENGARQLQFGLTEAGEQHKQGLKEAAGKFGEKHKQGMEAFGEKHKEGMNKAAGKVGGKFAGGLISGASIVGFFFFLVISKIVDDTIFTIDVLGVLFLVMCNLLWFHQPQ